MNAHGANLEADAIRTRTVAAWTVTHSSPGSIDETGLKLETRGRCRDVIRQQQLEHYWAIQFVHDAGAAASDALSKRRANSHHKIARPHREDIVRDSGQTACAERRPYGAPSLQGLVDYVA